MFSVGSRGVKVDLNTIFLFVAVFLLFFSLYKMLVLSFLYRSYFIIVKKVSEMKENNNSDMFIREELISEGFKESLVIGVLEDFGSE